jgi:hypothetical protein
LSVRGNIGGITIYDVRFTIDQLPITNIEKTCNNLIPGRSDKNVKSKKIVGPITLFLISL